MEHQSLELLRAQFSHLQSEIELMTEVAPRSHVLTELRERAERLLAAIEELGGGH